MKKLYGLYWSLASVGLIRASSNAVAILAGPKGLLPANDITSAADQIAVLAPYFDADFYASWYGITADPVRDYLVHGWREGRDPRPDFSSAAYLAE
ncbi:hypothetical protein, partial [Methylobacterium longum]